jgi:AcrR family transcriptional regulator
MARPRSEDKRNALLAAATQVFANKGLTAPTSAITSAAGLAEGTLFVYFKGKDELINTLYEDIKVELSGAMLAGYKKDAPIRSRMQHVWNNYVEWGVKNPERLAVSHKIKVWEGLKPEVQEATTARFAELHSMIKTAVGEGIFQDLPQSFVIAMLSAQAETTMQFMRQDPSKSKDYQEKGFLVFWNGLCKKP